jgi:uncharacterized membrane protein
MLVALAALPWVITASGATWLTSGARTVASLFCHQLPGHALSFGGVEMPLCSRCAGCLLGAGLGALFAWPRVSSRWLFVGLAATAALMTAHAMAQTLAGWPMDHGHRLVTGLAFGWLVGVAVARPATFVRPWRSTRGPVPS